MLHLVQSVEGRVTPEGIEACADVLGLTGAEVSAVATFYTMYKRRPVGDYHVGVCTNTLCAVMGGDLIFERLKEHLGVGNDETTEDGKVTLEHLECNAACDYAPVMMVNWEFFDDMTPESADPAGRRPADGTEVKSPRGATVCTWKEAERVLAGFPDGRADEGPTGGKASAGRAAAGPRAQLDRAGSGHSAVRRSCRETVAARPRRSASGDQPGKESGDRIPGDSRLAERGLITVLTPVLSDNWDQIRAWTLASYQRVRRLRRAEDRAADAAGRRRHRGQGLRPARPWRRGLPDRA